MLTRDDLNEILNQYIEIVIPAMLQRGYHLVLVKGGPDYPHLAEQSHFTHIVNGVFALARLLEFVIERQVNIPRLDASALRQALAMYTVHEVHKDSKADRAGASEFDIPLERLREEYEALGLERFAGPPNLHLLRAANVHKRSPRQGDLLLSGDPEAGFLWLLVRIADAMASAQTPEEALHSLSGYLPHLSPVFVPQSPPGRFKLYLHELRDVRGVLTNAIHQAVARQLEDKLDLFPLLYFATGTLYIGPTKVSTQGIDDLILAVADRVLQLLGRDASPEELSDAIREGLRKQRFDFERYVYAFASVEDLLRVVYEDTLTAKPNPKMAIEEIEDLTEKRKGLPADWRETVEERLGIRLLDPKEHKAFNELWSLVHRYLLYVDALLRDLNPAEDRLEWLLRTFAVPQPYADHLRREAEIWAKGGIGKYVLVIAYHFLRGPDFADRPAETLPPAEVLGRLHRRVLEAMQRIDTNAGRQAAVAELGLQQDLEAFLRETLRLSFAPATQMGDDGLASYIQPKRKGHTGKICSLCNRYSEYVQPLRTGILDDFGRVFSNRVLPGEEAPQGNRLWCPICQLEAILRKAVGMGLPSGADYKNSRRIYLYVLPTYSFTPEHIRLFEPVLRSFQRVTNLPVRDYGRDLPGLPRLWLEHRTLDPLWIERVQGVLEREAERIAAWGGRNYVGERIFAGSIEGQPHYYPIIWEKAARGQEREDERLATRTEAWAKALFAAVILSGLTGCKVYVTERFYLPIADPADLKATITLDGPPPALRALLGGRGDEVTLSGRETDGRSGLEQALDLSAALWVVTTGLQPGKDKDISARLGRLNVDPLAGAYFYKEYGRENDGQSPGSPFDIACEVLLKIQGGELMDLVEKIARKSLEIAIPIGGTGRGKARRYELIFRETVSAMRKAQEAIPEMRKAALSGAQPSEQAIAELKRLTAGALLKGLERRQESGRGEIWVRARGEDLKRLVGEFVDIVVDELYLGRADGSFARFLRLENTIADGIYYYTDRHLSQMWEEVKQQRADQKPNTPSEEA
ncbi:MAG TPA: type I-D CRISPR-associated protein Cas10d/Csc3 [Thermoflexus sp.]|nr:type I-D CRISPR-associated protein Cas10d/Csc3 [Thermoflexus sp.]